MSGPSWAHILPELIPWMKKEAVTVELVADKFRIPNFEALLIIQKVRSSYHVRSFVSRTVNHYRIIGDDS